MKYLVEGVNLILYNDYNNFRFIIDNLIGDNFKIDIDDILKYDYKKLEKLFADNKIIFITNKDKKSFCTIENYYLICLLSNVLFVLNKKYNNFIIFLDESTQKRIGKDLQMSIYVYHCKHYPLVLTYTAGTEIYIESENKAIITKSRIYSRGSIINIDQLINEVKDDKTT